MRLGLLLGTIAPGQVTHICVPDDYEDVVLFTGEIEDVPETWDGVDVCYVQTSDGNSTLRDRVGSGVLCIGIEHDGEETSMGNEVTRKDIEKLGENYFDVSIYVDGKEEAVEHFCSFGSVWDIVDTMDATCESLGYDIENVAVNIGYDYVCDLVYGFHPTGPSDFEIVCDRDGYDRLVEELAA